MARKRRTHTPEFKAEAVKLVPEQGYSVAEAARSRGLHETLLRSWRKRGRKKGSGVFLASCRILRRLLGRPTASPKRRF